GSRAPALPDRGSVSCRRGCSYRSKSPTGQSVEGDVDDLVADLVGVQRAVALHPAREPVDRAEKAEGGDGDVDVAQLAGRLHLAQRGAQEVEVGALAPRDLSVLRGGEGAGLVDQD